MHTWRCNIRLAGTTLLVLMAACCLVSCGGRTPQSEIREPIQLALDSASRAITNDDPIEPMRRYLDSTLNHHAPLSSAEKLAKYKFYHWYYTTFLQGDYVQANRIADSALLLFQNEAFKDRNLKSYGHWMLLKGDGLVRLKQLNAAFTYYYQVKSEYLDHWDPCELSRFASRLGFVRYKQNNYRDALHHYLQAYAHFCRCADATTIETYYEAVTEPQGLLNGVAWFYDLLGQPDSASHYYHRALTFLERESRRFPDKQKATATARGVIYGNLGGLYGKIGQHEKAMHYLTESVSINAQPGYDHRDVQTAQIKLADLYIKLGRLSDAEQTIVNCRTGLDTLSSEDFELRWRRVYWQFCDKMGHLPDTYAAFQAYHTFKDSLEESNRAMFGADFTREFEQKERELAYAELAYVNKLNYFFLWVSIVALVLVLAIVYLIYANWKRSKRHVARLSLLNHQIRRRNEEQQLALLALQDSQRDNTRIMAMVAHDLRNPLSNIKMGVDHLLRAHRRDDDDANTSFLEIIGKSNDRALELIEELMQSYETDSAAGVTDEINLEAMVRDCVDIMQLRATKKEQVLVFEGERVAVRGSREKIWRVISNLIDNAIKFTPRGGQITVRAQRLKREAVIEVRDSGIGIDPDLQERIFEMGKSAGRKGTDGEPSTGLGLAIVKQIITAHNGRIHFTSSPETGTTFYVHLPL